MTACKLPALPQIDFPPGFPPAIPDLLSMFPKLPDLTFGFGIAISVALPVLPGFPPAFPPAIPDLSLPSLDFGFDFGIELKLALPGLPAFPPGFPPAIPDLLSMFPKLPELPTCPLD